MSSRFNNVPEENGVTVIFEQETTLGDYQVLYQKWYADDVTGDSVIFLNDDVGATSEQAFEELIRTSYPLKKDAGIALKRSAKFTSINFNMKRV
ncbi:hypothetical protein CR164_06770 [Prosthecochloris marina]|uniref:Uncharacterized protein n=1 Tax=Prosthecochloris marina TaxID=2017681 RepID=A0A317T5L3_9CHLB|nr:MULTISPECIES: hypothetical protein [Prosthecochloris]PWW82039.1 hypothetical protein CR164_06770 [Prosthecochloris marina]UZJ39645.1 hypothetical protein OO185_00700 [Prosthecochloris sp. SCSIO W1102]